MNVEEWLGKDNQLGIEIWHKKYQYQNESFDEWLDRVSGGSNVVRDLIVKKKFLFGGRILANRGLDKKGVKVTYSNCYVITPPEDSIESIFECAGKLARTFSYGGGAGIDLSKLAPRGAKINNTALKTSGAVSFTDLYSMVTDLIGQNGRRGALMLSIADDHPDLEEFIKVKTDLNRVTKANMSVRVSDAFMNAVRLHMMWALKYHRPETNDDVEDCVDAYELFHELCEANYDYGEPGCLYWDNIRNGSLLQKCDSFEFAGTNPCGEQPLPAGGSCLLGSINLAAFVKNGEFDFYDFREVVKHATMALNIVLDEGMPLHPLEEQRESVKKWRQIGLGIMGLADMLIKMGIEYGSEESLKLCDEIGTEMMQCAIAGSMGYTKFTGSCINEDVLKDIRKSRIYQAHIDPSENVILANTQLLTIAPTGSISTMLGISGGIEPIFAKSFTRTTKSLSDKEEVHTVYPKVIEELMQKLHITDDSKLPDYVVTAEDIHWKDRVLMQSIWQKHIDASISSTINLPEDTTVDTVEDIYLMAWETRCKGITIFRAGCKRDAILTATPKEKVSKDAGDDIVGKKRKLMTGCGSLHFTAFFDPKTGDLKETYLSKGSTGGCNNFMVGLSRMISLSARSGCSVEEIVDQLKSTGSCPSYAVRRATKGDTSLGACCPMAVGNALLDMHDQMMREIQGKPSVETKTKVINPCPKCGAELEFSGGCNVCKSCGWTKCD